MNKYDYSGLILLNKPAGITSHTALSAIKKIVKPLKVGHCGTLDKFAEGLLLVLTGYCTKLADYFSSGDKEYSGIIEFGKETDTLDPEGNIVFRGIIPEKKIIEDSINKFIGEIEQIPPNYSAVHVNGKRAYKLALEGKADYLKPRIIKINDIKLIEYEPPNAKAVISCGKGTYIRSLARDLGRKCGTYAYLKCLRREKSGSFEVKNACDIENFDPNIHIIKPFNFLTRLNDINIILVDDTKAKKILNGIPFNGDSRASDEKKYFAIFSLEEKFLAFGIRRDNKYFYKFIVPKEDENITSVKERIEAR